MVRTTAMKERARWSHYADKQHVQQEELLDSFIKNYGKMSGEGLSEDVIRRTYLKQAGDLQKSFEEFDMRALKPTEEARTKDLAKGSGTWRDDFDYQFGKDMRKLDIRTERGMEAQSLKTFRKLDRKETVKAKDELAPVWDKQKSKANAVISTRTQQFTESEFVDRSYMSGKKYVIYRTKTYRVCAVCKAMNGRKFPLDDVMRNLVPRPDGKSPINKFGLQDDIRKAQKATPIALARNNVANVRGKIQKLNNEYRKQESLPLQEFLSPGVRHRRKQILDNINNAKYDLDIAKKNFEEVMPPVKNIKSTMPIGLDGSQIPLRAFIDGLDSTEARPELGMLAFQKTDYPPDAVASVHDWIAKTASTNLKDSRINPQSVAAWLPEDKLNKLYDSAAGAWNSPQGRDWKAKEAGWDEQSDTLGPLFESLVDPRNIAYRKMPRDVLAGAFVAEPAPIIPITRMADAIGNDEVKVKKLLDEGGWDTEKAKIFTEPNTTMGAYFHTEKEKIYAMSVIDRIGDTAYIVDVEVNPDMQRQGYGTRAMQDIVFANRDAEKISVGSMDDASDRFYEAIGMEKIPKKDPKHFQQFIGDKAWMDELIASEPFVAEPEVPELEAPVMKDLNVKDRMKNAFGEEAVNIYDEKISKMSKEELHSEFSSVIEDKEFRWKSFGEWAYRMDSNDGYATKILDLDRENSRWNFDFEGEPEAPGKEESWMKSILLNQEELKRRNPSGVVELYRGMGPESYDEAAGKGLKAGDEFQMRSYNISSWSEYPEAANAYAAQKEKGIVAKINAPVENILWSTRMVGEVLQENVITQKRINDGIEYAVIGGGYAPIAVHSISDHYRKITPEEYQKLKAERHRMEGLI